MIKFLLALLLLISINASKLGQKFLKEERIESSKKPCKVECVHGECHRGLCECEESWGGEQCNILTVDLRLEGKVTTKIIKNVKEIAQISITAAPYIQALGDLRSQMKSLEKEMDRQPENYKLVEDHHTLQMQLAPFGGYLFLRDEDAIDGQAMRGALEVAISQALQTSISKASGFDLDDKSDNPIITDFKTFNGIEVNGVINAPDIVKKLYDIEKIDYDKMDEA